MAGMATVGVKAERGARFRARGLRWTAGGLLALASCSGPKLFVNFPEKSAPSGAAPTATTPAATTPTVTAPSDGSLAQGSSPSAAASPTQPQAPPAQAAAPAAEPALPEEPLAPYWALYADWRSEHEDILRKMETATFSLRSMEKMFLDSESALRLLGRRLDAAGRADLEAFLERYAKLRQQAVADIHRGILRDRLYRLGREISARFAPK